MPGSNELIFVPGFGGTELLFPQGASRYPRVLWISYPQLLYHGILSLSLGEDGVSPPSEDSEPLSPGYLMSSYYIRFVDEMRVRGWNVHAYPYDWRLSQSRLVSGLVALIEKWSYYGPVKLVAHSRGGLICQGALAALNAQGRLALVDRFVPIAVPFAGSYSPVWWFAGRALDDYTSQFLWAGTGIFGFVANAAELLRLACVTLPGMYELLPDPAVAATNGDPTAAQMYSSAIWHAHGVDVFQSWLTAAQARWSGQLRSLYGVRSHCIVGTGQRTWTGPFVPSALRSGDALGKSWDGDGAVLTWSATLPGIPSTGIPEKHCPMLEDRTVHDLTSAILRAP